MLSDPLEKYNAERRWLHRALIMYLFHFNQVSVVNKHWRIEDTAKYFGKSKSLTSENILLGKFHALIDHCITREEALYFLKGK